MEHIQIEKYSLLISLEYDCFYDRATPYQANQSFTRILKAKYIDFTVKIIFDLNTCGK